MPITLNLKFYYNLTTSTSKEVKGIETITINFLDLISRYQEELLLTNYVMHLNLIQICLRMKHQNI